MHTKTTKFPSIVSSRTVAMRSVAVGVSKTRKLH